MPRKPTNSSQKRKPLEEVSSVVNQSAASQSDKPQEQKVNSMGLTYEEYAAMARQQYKEDCAFAQDQENESESDESDVEHANVTNSTATTTSTSKKRKAETSLDDEVAAYKRNLDDVIDPYSFGKEALPSCQVVRNRINKLLDAGVMTKKAFSETIDCGGVKVLNDFLKQKGTLGGITNPVNVNAWVWFRQREVAKLKMPEVKKRQVEEKGTSVSTARGSNSKTASSLPDITDIYLPGQEDDDVSVYDTCDEIRRKINAHLKLPGVTQAQFCRDLFAQLEKPKIKGIMSKQLSDFRRQKGPVTGAKSTVFYAAYVYFEKLRIAQGKKKTKHREDMEDIWEWKGGFDRETDHRTQYVVGASTTLYVDRYGCQISR